VSWHTGFNTVFLEEKYNLKISKKKTKTKKQKKQKQKTKRTLRHNGREISSGDVEFNYSACV
jgi:hypothetical protein